MGMNYEFDRNIKAAQAAGDTAGADILRSQRNLLNALVRSGVVNELPREIPQMPVVDVAPIVTGPEFDSEAVWQKQSERYLKLGFHVETGYEDTDEGKQAYLNSLPKFGPQLDSFRGRFNIPLLVETRIKPERQLELANIRYLPEALENFKRHTKINLLSTVQDWEQDPHGYKTPDLPYVTLMKYGDYGIRHAKSVRALLQPYERGATLHDGVAFLLAFPNAINNKNYIALPGTSLGPDSQEIFCLRRWRKSEPGVGLGNFKYNSILLTQATCARIEA